MSENSETARYTDIIRILSFNGCVQRHWFPHYKLDLILRGEALLDFQCEYLTTQPSQTFTVIILTVMSHLIRWQKRKHCRNSSAFKHIFHSTTIRFSSSRTSTLKPLSPRGRSIRAAVWLDLLSDLIQPHLNLTASLLQLNQLISRRQQYHTVCVIHAAREGFSSTCSPEINLLSLRREIEL